MAGRSLCWFAPSLLFFALYSNNINLESLFGLQIDLRGYVCWTVFAWLCVLPVAICKSNNVTQQQMTVSVFLHH